MFEKERMFLHFQRFQHFRSAVFSFFVTNFHLFFPTMPFQTPIFLAWELSGKESRHYIFCVLLCAVQDAQCNTEESKLVLTMHGGVKRTQRYSASTRLCKTWSPKGSLCFFFFLLSSNIFKRKKIRRG